MTRDPLPVAVIGAGPIGLAAAAHLVSRGEVPIVLEAGPEVGAAVRQWAHVRVFSPWRYNVDAVAAAMLTKSGWTMPDPDHLPTGRELLAEYLEPLAALPEIQPSLRLDTRVVSVSRRGVDKLRTEGRDAAPFVLRVRTSAGEEQEILARAVIDASGTSGSPNPLGADGTSAQGEADLGDRVSYGIPDVLWAGPDLPHADGVRAGPVDRLCIDRRHRRGRDRGADAAGDRCLQWAVGQFDERIRQRGVMLRWSGADAGRCLLRARCGGEGSWT